MELYQRMEKYLESTLLRADAGKDDIRELCTKALRFKFLGVCVNPFFVPYAASILQGRVLVVTVIGFPLGCTPGSVKAFEAERAFQDGAGEVDMVINLSAVKSRERDIIVQEIKEVAKAGPVVKVIIETGYLTTEEIAFASQCAVEGGAAFVKTSTGFGPRGASLQDIHLLRALLPSQIGIKAAGGIKSAEFAGKLLLAGADRIGTSMAEQIYQEARQKLIQTD